MHTKTINQKGETRYLMDLSEREMKVLVAIGSKQKHIHKDVFFNYPEWDILHDELLGGDLNIPYDAAELVEWALNK